MYPRPSKVKEVATVAFALLFVLAGVVLWAIFFVDSMDDCMSRGHSVGWCMRSHSVDVGR
jgi:hypothetical protein